MVLPQATVAQSIRGRVLDARTYEPIAAVDLTLIRADSSQVAQVLTDSIGRFTLPAAGGGSFLIRTARIGYADATLGPVRIDSTETLEVQLTLHTRAVALSGLVVTTEARSRSLELTGFYDRRKLGLGRFVDRAAIEKRNASYAHQLFMGMPGVRIMEERYTLKFLILLRSGIASGKNIPYCPPQVFQDGFLTDFDWATHPDNIEAIEVYRGGAEIPPQYGGAYSGCGVILVWTRRGG